MGVFCFAVFSLCVLRHVPPEQRSKVFGFFIVGLVAVAIIVCVVKLFREAWQEAREDRQTALQSLEDRIHAETLESKAADAVLIAQSLVGTMEPYVSLIAEKFMSFSPSDLTRILDIMRILKNVQQKRMEKNLQDQESKIDPNGSQCGRYEIAKKRAHE
jgi:hypothetical protein